MTKLSVVIPIFNENGTLAELLRRVVAVPIEKEIIIVDDKSTDGSRERLKRDVEGKFPGLRVIYHKKNKGKGGAVRTGIHAAHGEYIVIQDADLEYDPADYLKLLNAMETERVNVVYGSRFLHQKKVTAFWHQAVNRFLTELGNALYGAHMTDMETCYKMFRAKTLQGLHLYCNGFEIEVELTAKTLKAGERIVEVPVSYHGRSYHDGKKIGWRDGFKAVHALFYYRFFDKKPWGGRVMIPALKK